MPTWLGYITRGLHLSVLIYISGLNLNSYVMCERNGFKSIQKEIMGVIWTHLIENTRISKDEQQISSSYFHLLSL